MLIYAEILVDTDSCTVTYKGEIVPLLPKEYQLLTLFLKYPNHILSYDAIVDNLWDIDRIPTCSGIRTHIKNIRKAFKKANCYEDIIENIYGMGYRLNPAIKNKAGRNDLIAPAVSTLSDFLRFKAIEYLAIDEEFKIKYISPSLMDYCDYPENLQLGIYAGIPFPELIGIEEVLERVRNKQDKTFEIKGIARACNPNRPEYINFYAIADEPKNTENLGKQLLFVFFENASEQMIYKQRLVQIENEMYLLLESNKHYDNECLSRVRYADAKSFPFFPMPLEFRLDLNTKLQY